MQLICESASNIHNEFGLCLSAYGFVTGTYLS